MKLITTTLALGALLIAAVHSPGEPPAQAGAAPSVEITADQARSMKGMSVNELESKAVSLDGQIIKLKFSYRDTEIRKEEDGSYRGMLQSYLESSNRRRVDSGWGMVNVSFPKEAMQWFSRIPTNIDSRASLVVIGRVEVPAGGGNTRVQLLGREIKTDMKGSRVVW